MMEAETDDNFTKIGDTVPISPFKGTSMGRKTRLDDKFQIEFQTSDSVGKYQNLEHDVSSDPTSPAHDGVQLQFVQENGSSWSLNSSTASSAQHVIRWYRHPKVREHWKVMVASFVLFFIGICLCIVGVVLEALEIKIGGIFMLFVIGIFCFIPGLYHIIAVYYAVKGKRGFSFYNLPLFN